MEQEHRRMVFDESEYLDAVREHAPASTKEIADAVGVTRQGADYRLRELESDGKVSKKMVGNSLVWMVNEARETRAMSGEKSADGQVTVATTSEDENRSAPAHGGESEAAALVDVDSLTFNRDLTPARREHLQAWLRYAADHDSKLSKSDFEAWWTDDRHAEAGYNTKSFWEAFAKAAMKQSDRFSKPDMRSYRYVGDVDAGDGTGDDD